MKEKVEFERFEARDKEGRTYKIIGYQYFITHIPVYGQPVVLKGDIEYWTDSGLPATKVDSGTFLIPTTKETITRLAEKFSRFMARPKVIEVYADKRYE